MSNTPTKEMVEAFHKAYDASLEMQPRETSQAIYDGLSAALQSAADTPAPQTHVGGSEPIGYCVWISPTKLAACAKTAKGSFPVYARPDEAVRTLQKAVERFIDFELELVAALEGNRLQPTIRNALTKGKRALISTEDASE